MRELTIDWNGLYSAFQMNMPEVRCFLSLSDGKVLKLPPGDPALATTASNPARFVPIETVPSRIQYHWVDEFVRTIEEPVLRARLEAAINGKGAFRRFKDVLLTLPDERRKWFEYRDQMVRQRIAEWVLEHGIVPTNVAPWVENPHMLHGDHGDHGGGSTGTVGSANAGDMAAASNANELDEFLARWMQQQGLHQISPELVHNLARELHQRFRIKSPSEAGHVIPPNGAFDRPS